MSTLIQECEDIRFKLIEVLELVKTQVKDVKSALLDHDIELAQQVLINEEEVNKRELQFDIECERILALYNPVAADLRFIIATMHSINQIERIGDHCNNIALYITKDIISQGIQKELAEKLEIENMFDTALSMLSDIIQSFKKEDTKYAQWVFGKDKTLNQINAKAPVVLATEYTADVAKNELLFYIYSIMKKIERIGDHSKNIAEEIIFYLDVKVLKHTN